MNQEAIILALAAAFAALALVLLALYIRQRCFESQTKEAFQKIQELINKGAAARESKRV